MPWTKADVDEHNSGLTDRQKSVWVRVANDALRKCKEEGGSNCDASAIRQANAAVRQMNQMEIHVHSARQYDVRTELHDGRKYLVVPVVMMVEGVHSGSVGPVLHRADQLAQYLDTWNNRPITLEHPKVDGEYVSANSPGILTQYEVGRTFNTHFEDNKLKAEAWIDEQKIIARSPTALSAIRKGQPLEVSVGVFSETAAIEGEWHGETYESVAEHYRPDHLALLPEGKGACSWEDGCGIRVNMEGGTMDDLPKVFKDLAQKGYAVSPVVNEPGYRQITETLQSKLNAMDKADRTYYLQDVFADYFVYAVQDMEQGSQTLYKRTYSIDVNDEVEIGDSPTEVRKKTEYVTMGKMVRTKFNNNSKKGGKMACCEDKVDRLIANKLTRFSADDKEWLMSLEESQLDRMSPKEPEKKEVTPPPQVNKEEVIDEFKGSLKSIEDYTKLMPEEMKAMVNEGVTLHKERREKLIKGIMDNTKDVWEEDTLKEMPIETLERVAKSIGKPVDYSGMGQPPTTHTAGEDEEPPLDSSPDFNINSRKEDK